MGLTYGCLRTRLHRSFHLAAQIKNYENDETRISHGHGGGLDGQTHAHQNTEIEKIVLHFRIHTVMQLFIQHSKHSKPLTGLS